MAKQETVITSKAEHYTHENIKAKFLKFWPAYVSFLFPTCCYWVGWVRDCNLQRACLRERPGETTVVVGGPCGGREGGSRQPSNCEPPEKEWGGREQNTVPGSSISWNSRTINRFGGDEGEGVPGSPAGIASSFTEHPSPSLTVRPPPSPWSFPSLPLSPASPQHHQSKVILLHPAKTLPEASCAQVTNSNSGRDELKVSVLGWPATQFYCLNRQGSSRLQVHWVKECSWLDPNLTTIYNTVSKKKCASGSKQQP